MAESSLDEISGRAKAATDPRSGEAAMRPSEGFLPCCGVHTTKEPVPDGFRDRFLSAGRRLCAPFGFGVASLNPPSLSLSRRCSRATCVGRGFDALGLRLARGRGRAGGFGSTGSRRGAGRLGGTRRARSTRSPGGTARQGGFRQIGATFLARRPLGVVHGPARRAFLRQADA